MLEIERSQIQRAPYNPRIMTDAERRKLKRGISKLGLLQPLVWNQRTGNLVAGHQRLTALDSLAKSQSYKIKVAAVDLDDKQEKEANILLNNSMAQGDWDLVKLEALLRDPALDFDAAGFDTADVFRLFGDNPLAERPEQTQELADISKKAAELYDNIKSQRTKIDDNDLDFYCVVVFKNGNDRTAFLNALGLDDNRFQDGRELRRIYGLRATDSDESGS